MILAHQCDVLLHYASRRWSLDGAQLVLCASGARAVSDLLKWFALRRRPTPLVSRYAYGVFGVCRDARPDLPEPSRSQACLAIRRALLSVSLTSGFPPAFRLLLGKTSIFVHLHLTDEEYRSEPPSYALDPTPSAPLARAVPGLRSTGRERHQ